MCLPFILVNISACILMYSRFFAFKCPNFPTNYPAGELIPSEFLVPPLLRG